MGYLADVVVALAGFSPKLVAEPHRCQQLSAALVSAKLLCVFYVGRDEGKRNDLMAFTTFFSEVVSRGAATEKGEQTERGGRRL